VTPAPRPVAPDRLADVLADHLVAAADAAGAAVLRVAVDGAPAGEPAGLADALVDPLRLRGRPALRVGARWFLRPASLRFERGRTDPDAFRDGWLDAGALRREVLEPVGPNGSGRYLPTLWDPDLDRATRASYAVAPTGAVLLVDGCLLLGRGLPFDLTVHVRLSAAALARRTPANQRWTLPAFARYEAEVDPDRTADVVVRLDDPRHPAITLR
jgi:hypothetical protein